MSSYTPKDPREYKLYSIFLLNPRTTHQVNITQGLISFNIFEHLDKPYLTGVLTFADTSRILEMTDFKGTERIIIKMGLHQSDKILEKQFIVRNVKEAIPSTDTDNVITINLIEYDGFVGTLRILNKAYDGKPGVIINDMLRDVYGNKKIAVRGEGAEILQEENWNVAGDVPTEVLSAITEANSNELQAAIRYIAPNVNIFEAIEFITARVTGLTGTPFYCYACLADENLRFYDLFNLIRRPSVNYQTPFLYSGNITQNANINTDVTRLASELTMSENDNTLEMILAGNLGSTYEFVDPTHGLEYTFNFDLDEVFKNILGPTSHPVADTRAYFGDRPLSKYQSKRINLMAPSLLYYDQKNPYEEYNTAAHTSKAVQKVVRGLLGQEAITITVPGVHTMPQGNNGNKTIGRVITFVSLGDMQQHDQPLDRRRSGDYLVYAACHSFTNDAYNCKMDLVKLSNYEGNTKVYDEPPAMSENAGAGPQ